MGEDRDKLAPEPDVEAHRKHGREVTDEPDESKLIARKEADDEGEDVEAHRKFGRE